MSKVLTNLVVAKGNDYLGQSHVDKVLAYTREVKFYSLVSEKSNTLLSRIEALEHRQPVSSDRSRQQAEYRRADATADREQIVFALEDPRFKWRTINGISQQTGFEPSKIRSVLTDLANRGIAIRSTALASDGSDLYSTRKHFKHWASFWERLGAAFRNRAA